jgi:hypothetical protein
MYHPENLYILQGKVLGGIIEINSEREREPASWFLARKSIRTILPYIISRICRPSSSSSSSKRERREKRRKRRATFLRHQQRNCPQHPSGQKAQQYEVLWASHLLTSHPYSAVYFLVSL